jgi:hypothetical protein
VGSLSPLICWLGLHQPTWSNLEFWIPKREEPGKTGRHSESKYRVPHGSQPLVAHVLHYPPSPAHANSFIIGTAVINTQSRVEFRPRSCAQCVLCVLGSCGPTFATTRTSGEVAVVQFILFGRNAIAYPRRYKPTNQVFPNITTPCAYLPHPRTWVGSRSPLGCWVGCPRQPGVLGSIPKREEPGKTGRHPVLKYRVPHGSHPPTRTAYLMM